jgi:hypothetical protein
MRGLVNLDDFRDVGVGSSAVEQGVNDLIDRLSNSD